MSDYLATPHREVSVAARGRLLSPVRAERKRPGTTRNLSSDSVSATRHPLTMRATWLLTGVLLMVSAASYATAADQPPNVVLVLTDDQGWGDLSVHGNRNLQTPNIDSLARDGASFDRFFVCPVCSPTRAELLTGRYHLRSGVYSTSAGGERMDLDENTVAEAFQAAGYATAAFGKWHNGMQFPYHPNARGFDLFYGFCSGHWGNYFDPVLERNNEQIRGEGFVIDDFTTQAIRFMEEHQKRPFFVYLPFNTPHSPMQVPDRWWDEFATKDIPMRHRDKKRENLLHTRAALAMCENIDWNVGRLLKTLDRLELSNNTIVLYLCDNGPNGSRWNGGMKGRKGSTDEGGVRSPLLVRWPKSISGGTEIKEISGAVDLLPTLCDLADIDRVGNKPLDGVSLKPLLIGSDTQWPDRLLISHWRNKVSVRSQQFRLDHQGKLFDMVADPGQHKDIARQNPKMAARLNSAAAEFKRELIPNTPPDFRPFTIGHPAAIMTQLPARDGIGHGEIQRSNRFPNCSYFTNWKRSEDKISWDVEVLTAGSYQVELHYTCAPEDIGVVLELSHGDSRLRKQVTVAHTSEPFGGEHDRVKRVESYVKNFGQLNLGTIELAKGRSSLDLRAPEIPGHQAVEVRLLLFKRVGGQGR